MLIHFSWLHYGVAVLIAAALYYAWVGWRYYRHLLAPRTSEEELWANEVYEPVGRPLPEEGSLLVAAEDLDFAQPLDRLGAVPDLLEEIKTLAGAAGTKEDFLALFRLIAARYPQVAGSPQQIAINGFIRDQAPFQFTDSELNQLFHA